jgi:3-phosphoshikimate 1-carboxyvinyltransferase
MPVASAQVKSCLLLAGMYADGPTTIVEPGPARDHTERMLQAMGADLTVDANRITIQPEPTLKPLDLTIPADISSAAFLLVAGAVLPDCQFALTNIGINPTRTGFLDAMRQMGLHVPVSDEALSGGEPVATLSVQTGQLIGVAIKGDLVVRMIDEFPALMIAATQAQGTTTVSDARELRVKETDRIAVMASELRKMGVQLTEADDGFSIAGPQTLRGATVDGHDDHRVAMSLVIAGLMAEGETVVEDARCVHDSFPGFVDVLRTLGADVRWV